jgi:chaperonin GroEL (HSP60 family)
LIKTLQHKRLLHDSEDGGFVSLRTWRKSQKQEQLQALSEAIKNPTAEFLEAVASEFADSAKKMLGQNGIGTVVPLPAGNNLKDVETSHHLSELVAAKLGAKFINALEAVAASKKPANTKARSILPALPFKCVQPVEGNVLLLGDFAARKHNIWAAQSMLRNTGSACIAMSWLGPLS